MNRRIYPSKIQKNRTEKQNRLRYSQTGQNFFIKKKNRRRSQLAAINDIIQVPQANNKFEGNLVFKCHFRKRKNKIQNNLNVPRGSPKHTIDRKYRFPNDFQKVENVTKNEEQKDKFSMRERQNYLSVFNIQQKEKKEKSLEGNYKSPKTITTHRKTKTQNFKMVCRNLYKTNDFSRYKRFELLALYRSLLDYADNDPVKFLRGFQSALSYQKIILKPEIIKKKLWEKGFMTLEFFMETYKYLQNVVFIQNIIDFFEIIFQPYRNCQMSLGVIIDVFMKRSPEDISRKIAKLIFKRLEKNEEQGVYLTQIIDLCQNNFDFCTNLTQLSTDINSNSKVSHTN